MTNAERQEIIESLTGGGSPMNNIVALVAKLKAEMDPETQDEAPAPYNGPDRTW